VLYRPPESIISNEYGIAGDIYQTGIILFQLLGGALPYGQLDWLTKAQLKEYATLHFPENTVFADQCLLEKIRRGKLLDFDSLPAWTSDRLKRIVRTATRLDAAKRFSSAAEFLAKLAEELGRTRDWTQTNGHLTLPGRTSYRIVNQEALYRAQKCKTSSVWRYDNALGATEDLRKLILEIEDRLD
jgi:hypothetical protein